MTATADKTRKTVLITGGATGIGAASVEKFLAAGWNTAFMDIQTEAAGQLAARAACPERLLFIEGDTRERTQIRRTVEAVIDRFGHLDSVVANAGIHRRNTLLDISDEELDLLVRTNIYGTVNTLREAVPRLIDNGGGTVVINASDQCFIGKARNFGYGLTKGALGQITRSLSIELGPYHIRVNAVCPGTIHTPLVDRLFTQAAEQGGCSVQDCWQEEDALFARGSAGRPEEVAEVIFFLAGDASSFCTGGHYLVDGGLVAK